MINLLTGPVDVAAEARRAMHEAPGPHRSRAFLDEVAATRGRLCELTGAARAQLLLGSGTLANDVVAAQLSRDGGRGLVLTNGEFGDRLVNHATRAGLRFDVVRRPWGEPLPESAVAEALAAGPAWLWCVQLETSTGVLNDVRAIAARCAATGTVLCLDTISALGLVPLDLRGVRFATGVSGKGLRAYPGLALVFYNHPVDPDPALPRYLDLGLYDTAAGVPFTHSSNLVAALRHALTGVDWPRRYARIREASTRLRGRLRARGLQLVAPEAHAAPGVVTIELPQALPSEQVAAEMERQGILLGAGSDYLRDRNWIQISLMSCPGDADLDDAVEALWRTCTEPAGVPGTAPAPVRHTRRRAR